MKVKYLSFGATSAVITSLAIMVGLIGTEHAKASIITALLVIAIADNIADSFGIHVHQESQSEPESEVRKTTFTNFGIRLVVVLFFVSFVALLPIYWALGFSTILGLAIITVMSYSIAKEQKTSPKKCIMQHLLLTIAVMAGSFLLKELISQLMPKII